jgi:outer membrane lipoprotein SlyB
MKGIRWFTGLAALATLGGCASDPYYYNYGDSRYSEPPRYYSAPPPAYGSVAYTDYGRVVGIEAVGRAGGSTGAGAVVGGIVGGVLGHQVGSGRGNDAATVAGAIGGAVAGNEIEKRRSSDDHYRITVEMRDGRTATYAQESLNGIRVGDRVRVVDGRLYRD